MAAHSSILAWRIPMDRGAWWATVHGIAKSWTWHTHVHQILLIHQLMDTSVFGRYNYCWSECYCTVCVCVCVCVCRDAFLFVLEVKFLAQFIKKKYWMNAQFNQGVPHLFFTLINSVKEISFFSYSNTWHPFPVTTCKYMSQPLHFPAHFRED